MREAERIFFNLITEYAAAGYNVEIAKDEKDKTWIMLDGWPLHKIEAVSIMKSKLHN